MSVDVSVDADIFSVPMSIENEKNGQNPRVFS